MSQVFVLWLGHKTIEWLNWLDNICRIDNIYDISGVDKRVPSLGVCNCKL